MNMYGKEVNFGAKEEKEIDTESRIDALKGNKKNVNDLDKRAEEIQRAKERAAQEEKLAKERVEQQKEKTAAEGIDILCDAAEEAAKTPTIRRIVKTTAKTVVAAGAAWLVYRGVKFIVDKM